MTIERVVTWLNEIAPLDTAEGFDNVGLLIGDPATEVTGVMFGLDVTPELLREAVEKNANLIFTHHPFLFHAVKQIRYDSRLGHCLSFIMTHRLQVMAAHTNWDQAEGGISDTLAECLGLEEVDSADSYLRVGKLKNPMSSTEFLHMVEEKLHVQAHLYGEDQIIRQVAVAGGAYGRAALFCRADALVVGEISHADLLEGTERGLTIVCAEHYATEYPGLLSLKERFSREADFAAIPVFQHDLPPFSGARN